MTAHLARMDALITRCVLCGKQVWAPTGCTLNHYPEEPYEALDLDASRA